MLVLEDARARYGRHAYESRQVTEPKTNTGRVIVGISVTSQTPTTETPRPAEVGGHLQKSNSVEVGVSH